MRTTLLVLAWFVAAGALFGGIALVAGPSGELLGMPLGVLTHTPFSSFLIPGWLLVLVVGGSQIVAGVAHGLRRSWAPLASLAAGVILVGWIVVQVILVRGVHWLHALYFVLGVLQAGLAWRVLGRVVAVPGDAGAVGFLENRCIAFVGLSPTAGEFSRAVAKALAEHGHEVVPVNPRAAAAGEAGYVARIPDLADPPVAALLMVPPERALEVVEDCIAAGVRSVWFHRGVGPGSASPEAVARAREAGLQVVTDACPLMYLEPTAWYHRAHRTLAHAA